MLKLPAELVLWISGLLYISLVPPRNFSFCIFHFLGFEYCPGCGLGHAVYYLVHGKFEQSFAAHPLASFAMLIIIHRIYILIKLYRYQLIQSKP